MFTANFFAVDANAIKIFSKNEITFTNPYCKKKNTSTENSETQEFSKTDSGTSLMANLNSHCTSQFQFEVFSWENKLLKPITDFNEHFSSRLSYLYFDSTSPPPRRF